MRLREPVVYAVLLLLALGFAYQTWARDETDGADAARVPVWEESPDAVLAVRYVAAEDSVLIERRGSGEDGYLWATVREPGTTPPPAGAGADSAAAGEVGDTATAQVVDTTVFVVSARGDRLVEDLAAPQALRDLGVVDDAGKAEYGLADTTARITVDFGETVREVVIGSEVYGSGDRYALDPATSRAYVLPEDVVDPLENATARLLERRLHAFGRNDVTRVIAHAGGQERVMQRSEGTDIGDESWTAPDTPDRPDQTFANFMDRLRRLWVNEYEPDLDVSGLERVIRVEYFGAEEESLGFLELFRRAGADGEPEYLLRTELTRVPARTYGRLAEEVAGDVEQIF